MSPADAARLLEIPADATSEQIEARFLELRTKLEEKIGKAPTPGLKAKYRESLEEITKAFETLTLAADSSALPVLRREKGVGSREKEDRGQTADDSLTRRSRGEGGRTEDGGPGERTATAKKKSGSREFVIVAAIAVVVLGAGGWWVMKTRAENAEKARVAAEAKAATDKAAEEKRLAAEAERERQEKLVTSLRSRMAELNVAYEAAMRAESTAERELSELKSHERELARDAKDKVTSELRAVGDKVRAADSFVAWLRAHLPTHPAKIAKARADEMLSVRAVDEAAAAVAEFEKSSQLLAAEIARARDDLLRVGAAVEIDSNPQEVAFVVTDVYGRTWSGHTPARVADVPFGALKIIWQREGWPATERSQTVARDERHNIFSVDLNGGVAEVTSEPAGVKFTLTGQGRTERGTTPAKFDELPLGAYTVAYDRPGWPGEERPLTVKRDEAARVHTDFPGGTLVVNSDPAGAEVWLDGRKVGTTPFKLTGIPPGRRTVAARMDGRASQSAVFTAASERTAQYDFKLSDSTALRALADATEIFANLSGAELRTICSFNNDGYSSTPAGVLTSAYVVAGDEAGYQAVLGQLLPRLTSLGIQPIYGASAGGHGVPSGFGTSLMRHAHRHSWALRDLERFNRLWAESPIGRSYAATMAQSEKISVAAQLILDGKSPEGSGLSTAELERSGFLLAYHFIAHDRLDLAREWIQRSEESRASWSDSERSQANSICGNFAVALTRAGSIDEAMRYIQRYVDGLWHSGSTYSFFLEDLANQLMSTGNKEVIERFADWAEQWALGAPRLDLRSESSKSDLSAEDAWRGYWLETLRLLGRTDGITPWAQAYAAKETRSYVYFTLRPSRFLARVALDGGKSTVPPTRTPAADTPGARGTTGGLTGALVTRAIASAAPSAPDALQNYELAPIHAARGDWTKVEQALRETVQGDARTKDGWLLPQHWPAAAKFALAAAERFPAEEGYRMLGGIKERPLRMLALALYSCRMSELERLTPEQRAVIARLPPR